MIKSEAQKEFRSMVTNVSHETIYTIFKKECAKRKRPIKSVLCELMRYYVDNKKGV